MVSVLDKGFQGKINWRTSGKKSGFGLGQGQEEALRNTELTPFGAPAGLHFGPGPVYLARIWAEEWAALNFTFLNLVWLISSS